MIHKALKELQILLNEIFEILNEIRSQIQRQSEYSYRKKSEPDLLLEKKLDYKATVEKNRLNFLKWFLGTLVLGAATTCSTHIIQENELEMISREKESTYIMSYVSKLENAIEKDSSIKIDKAILLSQIISHLVIDKQNKKAWESLTGFLQYYNDSVTLWIKNKDKDIREKIIQIDNQIFSLKRQLNDGDISESEINSIKGMIRSMQGALKMLAKDYLMLQNKTNQFDELPMELILQSEEGFKTIYDMERNIYSFDTISLVENIYLTASHIDTSSIIEFNLLRKGLKKSLIFKLFVGESYLVDSDKFRVRVELLGIGNYRFDFRNIPIKCRISIFRKLCPPSCD